MLSDKACVIAVVLATYNGQKYLEEQLDSLLQQQDATINIYCSDDNSTDATFNILEQYKRKYNNFNIEVNKGVKGPAGNFMNALRMVKDEDFAVFCDQDDVWFPEKISILRNFAAKNILKEKPGLVYCNAVVVDERLKSLDKNLYPGDYTVPSDLSDLIYLNGGVQGASMMINKAMINEMLVYSDFIYMHDQLATFVAAMNENIYYLNKPLMFYRQHEHNVIGTNVSFLKKIRILFNSSLINKKSLLFIKGFATCNGKSIFVTGSKSTAILLKYVTHPYQLMIIEFILGDARLHNSRLLLLIKLFVKANIFRVLK